MSALGVYVELGGNFSILKFGEVQDRVLDVYGIIFRLKNECGRGLRIGMNIGIRRKIRCLEHKVGWIKNELEIRTAAQLISGIKRVIESLIEVRAQCGRQIRASGKSQDADATRINVPLRSMLSHHAKRALCVLESRG